MTGSKKSYRLYYAGEKFALPTFEGEVFEEKLRAALAGDGVLRLQLNEGTWLTVVVGGGVSVALHESPAQQTVVL